MMKLTTFTVISIRSILIQGRISPPCRIPFWYALKLVFVAWLVLPQFKGAAFLYDRFVRENVRKYGLVDGNWKSPSGKGKGKNKFVDFITNKKVS